MAKTRVLPLVAASAAVTLAALPFTPLLDPDLDAQPSPAASFEEARSRIAAIQDEEGRLDLIPEGHSIALLSEERSARCVVIFHGYTAVPEQFRLIGEAYRAEGYNVWIPRLPRHGSADRMTKDFSRLSAAELREFADRSIDIGAGLGDELTVVGLSGGGALGLWAGFSRPEVAHTFLISPLLHPLGLPEWQDRPLARLLRVLPFDHYLWWDQTRQQPTRGGYDYPHYSLKGIAALLSLGHWVAGRGRPPATSTVLLVRNDGDSRLDGAFNERFVRSLVPDDRLRVFPIPAAAGMLHDLVGHARTSENYVRLNETYRYLSEALGVPIPNPRD